MSSSTAVQFAERSEPIRVGERAPGFVLKAANAAAGRNVADDVSLGTLLAEGLVIVEFLRGTW